MATPSAQFLATHPKFAAAYRSGDRAVWGAWLKARPEIDAEFRRDLARPAPQSAAPAPVSAPAAAQAPENPSMPATGTSAAGIIRDAMNRVGLGELGEWAWQQSVNGTPDSEISLGLRERPEYKTRFSGMTALNAKGRSISEGEYIGLEQTYAGQMRARGLPATFYDSPEDFGKLIAAEVSPQEFGERLALAEEAAMSNPKAQQVRDELTRLYNVPNAQGLMTAFFIDPDRSASIIKQQYQASTTAAASKRSGFGSLTQTEAERIAGLGITEQQAAGTFSTLAGMGEFQLNLPGSANDAVTRDELLAAGFEDNAQAKAKVERTARGRKATFEGGGGYASSQRGVSGLGTAGG